MAEGEVGRHRMGKRTARNDDDPSISKHYAESGEQQHRYHVSDYFSIQKAVFEIHDEGALQVRLSDYNKTIQQLTV